jgi:nitroreductase
MDILDAMKNRRSVREFAPQAPSRGEIEALVALATAAPCAANRQFWSFCVITDRALLDRLSTEARAYMTRVRPLDLPENLYQKLADPAFHVFYRAPALILVSGTKGAPWCAEDCALAAQNIMLAAVSAGLGTCWIGLCQPYLDTPAGRAAIGLAEDETPVAPIALGRPAAASAPVPRAAPRIRWL